MSEKQIIGIDIGSYEVKVVVVDPKAAELSVLGFERELVIAAAAPIPAGDAAAGGPPPLPKADALEDAPTGVREAPTPDSDDTVEKADGGADGEAAASIEFSSLPTWVASLLRLRDRNVLAGALQSTSMPDGQAMLIELEVPFEDKGKVQNILPHLMVDRLPLAQNEIAWDFQTYPPPGGAEAPRALVGFARNEHVEATLDFLGRADVDPAMLGVAELQLATIGARLVGEQEGVTAFVDLGHETTRVAVIERSLPLLGRAIRSGGRQITDAIQESFANTFEEAERVKHQYAAIVDDAAAPNADMKKLSDAIQNGMRPVVRELRRTFQGLFAKRRLEVQRVYICGGSSQIRNVEKFLSAELGIPVRRLHSSVPGMMDPEAGAVGLLALAAALTLQNDAVRGKAVNLRRGRFAYRGRSSYLRRQLVLAAAAIMALLMVLGVTLYMEKLSYEAQRDAMQSALKSQTKALLGAELTSKSAIQKVMDGGDTGSNSFIPKMSAYHLLYELTRNMPKDIDITLDRIEVDTDRNLILVYGETTDAQAVDRIVSDLESGIECLKEIKKDKLKVRDDKADFELQISSGCT